MSATPPNRIELEHGAHLRWFTVADAGRIAHAVGESLEELRPWMPWADERSTDASFQRDRLRTLSQLASRGEEWQYGLFGADESWLLGSFGLMTRRGPGTLEIGYWLHTKAVGQGHATRAAGALTDVARAIDGIHRVIICCDEANDRSAAIPMRLGYELVRVTRHAPEASGECGREMLWTIDQEAVAGTRHTPRD